MRQKHSSNSHSCFSDDFHGLYYDCKSCCKSRHKSSRKAPDSFIGLSASSFIGLNQLFIGLSKEFLYSSNYFEEKFLQIQFFFFEHGYRATYIFDGFCNLCTEFNIGMYMQSPILNFKGLHALYILYGFYSRRCRNVLNLKLIMHSFLCSYYIS